MEPSRGRRLTCWSSRAMRGVSVSTVPETDLRQSDVFVRGMSLGRGLPVVGDMCMGSAMHSDERHLVHEKMHEKMDKRENMDEKTFAPLRVLLRPPDNHGRTEDLLQ